MVWPGETPIEVLRKKSVMLACFLLLGTAFKANEAPAALVASSTPPTAADTPPKRGPWVAGTHILHHLWISIREKFALFTQFT